MTTLTRPLSAGKIMMDSSSFKLLSASRISFVMLGSGGSACWRKVPITQSFPGICSSTLIQVVLLLFPRDLYFSELIQCKYVLKRKYNKEKKAKIYHQSLIIFPLSSKSYFDEELKYLKSNFVWLLNGSRPYLTFKRTYILPLKTSLSPF